MADVTYIGNIKKGKFTSDNHRGKRITYKPGMVTIILDVNGII